MFLGSFVFMWQEKKFNFEFLMKLHLSKMLKQMLNKKLKKN